MKKMNAIWLLVFLLITMLGTQAHGQPENEQKHENEQAQENEQNSYEIDPIIVTAEGSKKDVQKIPMSIDVFTAPEITDADIQTIPELIRLSPNVTIKESPIFHYTVIRGISTFHTSSNASAGLVVDNIYYPVSYMQNIDLFDIEQAEILKGPQGTLYGRNSESGLISITTQQPGNDFQGKILSEYGSHDTFRVGAGVSGPVIRDTLYLGATAQYRVSDGDYVNLGSGDEYPAAYDHKDARGTLRWTPTAAWDLSLIFDYNHANDNSGALRRMTGPQATPPYTVNKDTEEPLKQDSNSQALRIEHKGKTFDFVSVTTALDQDFSKQVDHDFSPEPIRVVNLDLTAKAYSQEFRFSQDEIGPFGWLAGVYLFDEQLTRHSRRDSLSTGATLMDSAKDVDTRSYAAFGEGTYTPLDRLHLTAGLRLEHLDVEGHIKELLKNEELEGDMAFNEALPKFSIAYDLTEKAMSYATVAKGYKAGGYNTKLIPEIFTYEPEYLWNYEVGIRTSWLADILVANLSVFYMDLTDKQVSEYDEATAQSIITNAGSATSKGFELEVKARPLPGLDIFAGFGYAKATFDTFLKTVKVGGKFVENDYSGNDLPYAPRYTYNVGVQYRGFNGIFARADISGVDGYYPDADNKAKTDPYNTVNVRLGYEMKLLDIYFNVRNLFNTQYLTYGGDNLATDGPSREVSVSACFRF